MLSCHVLNGIWEEKRFFILMKYNFHFLNLWFMYLVLYLRNLCLPQGCKDFLFFLLEILEFYVIEIEPYGPFWVNLDRRLDLHFFPYGYPAAPAPFVMETFLSSTEPLPWYLSCKPLSQICTHLFLDSILLELTQANNNLLSSVLSSLLFRSG